MSNYIGIDFGMQNLKVCYYDGSDNWRVDLEGNQQSVSKVSRNAVYYREEEGIFNKFFFGSQEAETARTYNDPDYVNYIKRELQKESYFRTVCDGKYTFSALDIITDIFKQIAFKMEELRLDITAPTILTVPVIFSEAQKEKLKYCAEKAGFKVQEIITEPFAALFSEETYNECVDGVEDEEDYVLIFDFGASTLDICLFKIVNNDEGVRIETMSSTGLSFGGKDITDIIADFISSKLGDEIEEQRKRISGEEGEQFIKMELFNHSEELKNYLYEEEDIPEVERKIFGKNIVLKQTNINKLLDSSKVWDKISDLTDDMFECLEEPVDYEDVSKIVMTGGTSKIQYFRDKVEELFENAELIGDVEEEDSIYCSVSSGAVNYAQKEGITVKNSSPMSIGIDIGKGFEKALNRNSFYFIKGKRKLLKREWLESNNWQIKVYQTLKDVRERTKTNAEGILYAGYVQLNRDMYSQSEGNVYINFYCTPQGILAETALEDEIKQNVETNIQLKSEVNV